MTGPTKSTVVPALTKRQFTTIIIKIKLRLNLRQVTHSLVISADTITIPRARKRAKRKTGWEKTKDNRAIVKI
jgi:hypothetical protein